METDPVSEMLFSTYLEFRTMDKVQKANQFHASYENNRHLWAIFTVKIAWFIKELHNLISLHMYDGLGTLQFPLPKNIEMSIKS
jgi:hypothetical protein